MFLERLLQIISRFESAQVLVWQCIIAVGLAALRSL